LGPEAKALVPEVGKALSHMDPYLRPAFENWLQSLGSEADAAVPALIMILKDKKDPTRFTVAQTLGIISKQRQQEVIPVLTARSQDTNAIVRFWAAESLKELGQQPQTTQAKSE
jgi:HEAT repeat protein